MRSVPALVHLLLMTTLLAIAFRCDWTLYEFALLVVYDATLIVLLALLARPLQAVLTMLDLAQGELTISAATLVFALVMFMLLAIDVGMTMGLQAISTLPARSDALELTTAWSSLAQGMGIAVSARALQLLLASLRAMPSIRGRSAWASATGSLLVLATAVPSMLIEGIAGSTLLTITCLFAWQAIALWLLRR